MSFSIEYFKTF